MFKIFITADVAKEAKEFLEKRGFGDRIKEFGDAIQKFIK